MKRVFAMNGKEEKMSRLIDINAVIRMLNTLDRYTSTELTLCDTDKTFPKNEVFVVDDVYEGLEQLPSAEPESIRINLNESIKVKLTDWGKEIYYHQYDRINKIAGREICKPRFPKEDENGYTEFQLWYFMELYGKHMGMTLPNIIKPLEIVYKRRTR